MWWEFNFATTNFRSWTFNFATFTHHFEWFWDRSHHGTDMHWINNKFFIIQYMPAYGFLYPLLIALFTINKVPKLLQWNYTHYHLQSCSLTMSQRGFQFGRRLLANMIQKSSERTKGSGSFFFFSNIILVGLLSL